MPLEKQLEKATKDSRGSCVSISVNPLSLPLGNLGKYIRANLPQLNVRHPKNPYTLFNLPAEGIVFWDIETTGLKYHSPIFLITYALLKPGMRSLRDIKVGGFFARDYSEEKSMLSRFAECLNGYNHATYNGTTFDLSRVSERLLQNGIKLQNQNGNGPREVLEANHLDLLTLTRKLRGVKLPDFRLQTVEKVLFGHTRSGDISGERIPREYKRFMYERDNEQLMTRVIEHGLTDAVSLIANALYTSSHLRGKR